MGQPTQSGEKDSSSKLLGIAAGAAGANGFGSLLAVGFDAIPGPWKHVLTVIPFFVATLPLTGAVTAWFLVALLGKFSSGFQMVYCAVAAVWGAAFLGNALGLLGISVQTLPLESYVPVYVNPSGLGALVFSVLAEYVGKYGVFAVIQSFVVGILAAVIGADWLRKKELA
jgi:hypothetical protein